MTNSISTTVTDPIAIIAIVGSIVAIITSLVSIWITYKARTSSLREMIFAEQIIIAKKMSSVLTKIEFILDDYYRDEDSKRKENEANKLEKLRLEFWQLLFENSAFLDADNREALTSGFTKVTKVIDKVFLDEKFNAKEYEESFFQLETVFHFMFGIPKLTMETRNLIKSKFE